MKNSAINTVTATEKSVTLRLYYFLRTQMRSDWVPLSAPEAHWRSSVHRCLGSFVTLTFLILATTGQYPSAIASILCTTAFACAIELPLGSRMLARIYVPVVILWFTQHHFKTFISLENTSALALFAGLSMTMKRGRLLVTSAIVLAVCYASVTHSVANLSYSFALLLGAFFAFWATKK